MIMQPQQPPVEMKFVSSYDHNEEGVVLDMQYNHDGTLLATAYSSGKLSVYDLVQESKKAQICFADHKGGILKVSWSLPQLGKYLVSCSIDKTIKVYEVVEDRITKRHSITLECIPVTVAFCPWDQRIVLVAGLSNGQLQVYGPDFELSSQVPDAHLMSINCVSWSNEIIVSNQRIRWVKKSLTNSQIYMPNEIIPLLASVSSDKMLRVWKIDLEKLKLTKIVEVLAHENSIREVSWKPNLFIGKVKTMVTCSEDYTLKVWDLSTDKNLTERLNLSFPATVWRVQWNPLGTMLAVSITNEKEHLQTKIYLEDKDGKLKEVSKTE